MELKGQYLTYAEYKELGGTLVKQVLFDLLEYDVRKKIDKETFGRLINTDSIPTEVKMCVFKMVDIEDKYQPLETQNKTVASENTDGYSISYRNLEISDIEAKSKELDSVINEYLSNVKIDDVPVLYRGLDKC